MTSREVGQPSDTSPEDQPAAPGQVQPEIEEPVLGGPPLVPPIGEPTIGPAYDPSPAREVVRGLLAIVLVIALIIVVLVSLAIVWFKPENSTSLVEVLQIVLAPLVGLVGAATGFYYGTRQN